MHLITFFVSVFVASALLDHTLAACDCEITSLGCVDTCINEARKCMAECNTQNFDQVGNLGDCINRCLDVHWPGVQFTQQKLKAEVQETDAILDEDISEDKSGEEPSVVEESTDPEVVEEETIQGEDAEAQEAELEVKAAVDIEEASEEEAPVDKASEDEVSEHEAPVEETSDNEVSEHEAPVEEASDNEISEHEASVEEASDDEVSEGEPQEQSVQDEQVEEAQYEGSEAQEAQSDGSEAQEAEAGESVFEDYVEDETADAQEFGNRRNIFAVTGNNRQEEAMEAGKDGEEYYDVTQNGASASGNGHPTQSADEHAVVTITEYTTMTSHLTVMPNGNPVSSGNPSHGSNAPDVNSAVSMHTSGAIVAVMAMACAYLIV